MTGHEYLTTDEVAEIIRKTVDYVQRQCKNGNLRATKLGNDWRIHRASVDAFMSPGTTPATRTRRRAS